jgi:hypothetical protein
MNVTGDTMVCGMVSSLCPVTDDEDEVVDGDSTGHTKKPPSDYVESSDDEVVAL